MANACWNKFVLCISLLVVSGIFTINGNASFVCKSESAFTTNSENTKMPLPLLLRKTSRVAFAEKKHGTRTTPPWLKTAQLQPQALLKCFLAVPSTWRVYCQGTNQIPDVEATSYLKIMTFAPGKVQLKKRDQEEYWRRHHFLGELQELIAIFQTF